MRYKPIPISAAKEIAKLYGKQQVIIVTWDATHGKEHVTTYGTTKKACAQAAMGGNCVKRALGWPEALCNAVPKRLETLQCLHCAGTGTRPRQDNASGPGTPDDEETCGGCQGTGRVA